jgi:hypothetical protein
MNPRRDDPGDGPDAFGFDDDATIAARRFATETSVGDLVRRPGDPAILNADGPDAIPGEFLVSLRGEVPWREVRALSEALVARYGGTILVILEILPGFGLAATDEQARRIADDPAVGVVEQNRKGHLR